MLEGEQLEVLAYYRLSQDLSLYPEVNRALENVITSCTFLKIYTTGLG